MGTRIYSFVQFKMLFLFPFLIPFFIQFCLSFNSSPFVPSFNSRVHDAGDATCYFSRRSLWSLWRKLGPPVYFQTHIPTHICGALLFWARLCFTLYSKMSAKLNCSFFACPKFDIRRYCLFAGNPIIDPSAYASASFKSPHPRGWAKLKLTDDA